MPTLYLDMNIYNRPFDDQDQMRIRLETTAITIIFSLIERNVFTARWSFVLDYENSRNPFPERRAFVVQLAQACEGSIEPEPAIRHMAQQFNQQYQIKGRDALHLACAQLGECDYLVTCDDRLVKQGEQLRLAGVLTLRVINPIELIREM